jgi:CYTH domain-containing protein
MLVERGDGHLPQSPTSSMGRHYGGHNGEMEPSRYALVEDEQRFVVASAPTVRGHTTLIDDRYVRDSRLRLRAVTSDDEVVYKLGQKVPIAGRPSAVWHTTIYLTSQEYELFADLPAHQLSKRRHHVDGGCVDEFLGALRGLVLMEGPRPVPCPPGGVEVTDDARFRGGSLAALDLADATALVAKAAAWLS